MKILVFSDIHFPDELYKKSKDFVEKYYQSKNNKLKNLTNLIKSSKIELILLAGDVMGDFSGNIYFGAFSWLTEYLEKNKITTLFIQGNHDTDDSYVELAKSTINNTFVKEISGKRIIYKGLRILGLSFFDTANKKKLREYISQKEQIDILLCHCQNSRRPFLFEFDTRYIFTGHYDRQFCFIDNKVFISSFGSEAYTIIEVKNNSEIISIYTNDTEMSFFGPNPKELKAEIKNNKLIWKADLQSLYRNYILSESLNTYNYFHGFENCMSLLLKIKSEYKTTSNISNELKSKCKENRFNIHVPISNQIDFLGKECYKQLNMK